ncbi:MAG TPA: transcription elongation factor GreA [Jatrophihabitantaceae bacterium]|nr:transcription elongation factor GreA [Jatrophihabitantaceae bacterium]
MTTTGNDNVTWLTQDAHDRLSKELNELIAGRSAMAKEINDRREEGDLKENGGYHAAREEQGKQEGRILQLQQLLREAKVGEAPVSEGIAGPGMVVTIRYEGDDETESFLIGSREEAETAGIQVYSSASPLGKALTGAGRGQTVQYQTPTGKTIKVVVVDATPFSGSAVQRLSRRNFRIANVTNTSTTPSSQAND